MRARILAVGMVTLGLSIAGVIAPACVWTTASNVGDLTTSACTFQGMDTACGKCIATSCQHAINKVCDAAIENDAGTQVLTYLDSCAGGTSVGCSGLVDATPEDANGAAVVACVTEACTDACMVEAPQITCSGLSELPGSDCTTCIKSMCVSEVSACCNTMQSPCSAGFQYISNFIQYCLPYPQPGSCPSSGGKSAEDMALITCAATCAACKGMACKMDGADCSGDSECCGGMCLGGVCGTCTPIGDGCSFDTTCCDQGTCDMTTGACE